ncbi:hypothetical protein M0813_01205 [Anaeramoeba flamelloides]|uniref:Uncharacterized protein n=1 Tax=Anaeramoeba flamelloides TaxID=1746091 RepID=A0ABQ8ZE59_9EUKA|nr:hypothetical protein M0813_01205 [Anaeramoeba flamelloides]
MEITDELIEIEAEFYFFDYCYSEEFNEQSYKWILSSNKKKVTLYSYIDDDCANLNTTTSYQFNTFYDEHYKYFVHKVENGFVGRYKNCMKERAIRTIYMGYCVNVSPCGTCGGTSVQYSLDKKKEYLQEFIYKYDTSCGGKIYNSNKKKLDACDPNGNVYRLHDLPDELHDTNGTTNWVLRERIQILKILSKKHKKMKSAFGMDHIVPQPILEDTLLLATVGRFIQGKTTRTKQKNKRNPQLLCCELIWFTNYTYNSSNPTFKNPNNVIFES